MRRIFLSKWFIIALLLLGLMAGGVYYLQTMVDQKRANTEQGAKQSAVGTIVQQKGRAWSELDSSKRLLNSGDPIFEKDRIMTGRHARLIIKMNDDAVITLGEDTEMIVQNYTFSTMTPSSAATPASGVSGSGLLSLTRGFLRATSGQLAKLEKQPFKVRTPVATMGVRGTEFWGRVSYQKDSPTGEETPRLQQICFSPVCTTKNSKGEQVMEKPNQALRVDAENKAPSKPESAKPELLAKAHLSVMIPPKMSAVAVKNLTERMVKDFMDKGVAKTPEEAARLVSSTLDRIVEKAEWHAAEKAVEKLLQAKGKVTQEDVDQQLKEQLKPEEFDKLKQLEQEKKDDLASLDEQENKQLGEMLPMESVEKVQELLAKQEASKEQLDDSSREQLQSQLDADQAQKLLDLNTEKAKQKAALEENLKKTLEEVLPESDVAQVEELAQRLTKEGKTSSDQVDEALSALVRDEQGFAKVKAAIDNTLEQSVRQNAKVADEVRRLAPDAAAAAAINKALAEHEKQLTALESKTSGELQQQVGGSYRDVKQTIDDYERRKRETASRYGEEQKAAFSEDVLRKVSMIKSQLGDAKEISVGEIEAALQSDLVQEELQQVIEQVAKDMAVAIDAALKKNPDASAEEIMNSVERHLATDVEWKSQIVQQPAAAPSVASGAVDQVAVDGASVESEVSAQPTEPESTSETEAIQVQESAPRPSSDAKAPAVGKIAPDQTKTDEAQKPETPPTPEQASGGGSSPRYASDVFFLDQAVVAENSAFGTMVGVLTTNTKLTNDVYSFEFAPPYSNAGNRFSLNNGVITVNDGSLLNYEAYTEHTISIRATNAAKYYVVKNIVIKVADVNEAPTGIALEPYASGLGANDTPAIDENSPKGTIVATIKGADPDRLEALTYQLTNSADGRFSITGSYLVVDDGTKLDYETLTKHSVTIQVTDRGGLTFDKSFTINLNDVNEPPTSITIDNDTIKENSGFNDAVGTLTVHDPDAGEFYTKLEIKDSAGAFFKIDGDLMLVTQGAALDFESVQSYTFNVTVTDHAGLTYELPITIKVTNENEAPTNITLTPDPATLSEKDSLAENAPNDTVVGTLTTTDEDQGDGYPDTTVPDTFTYAFTTTGNSANGAFKIVDDKILVADWTLLDYNSNPNSPKSLKVFVTVTDHGAVEPKNKTYEKEFTIGLRPFACKYIPDSPTVADMQAASRATFASVLKSLDSAVAGSTVALTESQLENLIIGKVAQQLTSYQLTDAVNKFDVMISSNAVNVYTEVAMGDSLSLTSGLYARLASKSAAAQATVDTLFSTLTPYETDFKACVRVRLYPTATVDGGSGKVKISFLQGSLVDVHHDVDLLPNVSFQLSDLISQYNSLVTGDLALAGIRFFQHKNASVPVHNVVSILGSKEEFGKGVARKAKMEAAMNASGLTPTSSASSVDSSQTVPTSQFIDFYFPGLISNFLLNSGQVDLTRAAD